MKFPVDVNLSPKLAAQIQDLFPGSTHVYRRQLGPRDDLIWNYARDHGFAVLSKDSDFYRLSVMKGAPPKVVWLQVGNAGTVEIAALLRSLASELEQFDVDKEASLLVLTLG